MAHKWKRYGEGRLYVIGGSIAGTALLWSALFARDRAEMLSDAGVAPADTQPAAAQQLTNGVQAQQAASDPAPAPRVHTRTRGS